MAYESFRTVSWSDATPITSVRLQQMTTNIEQVKAANLDKPIGIVRYNTVSSDIDVPIAGRTIQQDHSLVELKLDGATDNRWTLESGRYYKLCLDLPPIEVQAPGGEDSTYTIAFSRGTFATPVGSVIRSYTLNSGIAAFTNVHVGAADIDNNLTLKSTIRFGAGTYTCIFIGAGEENVSFFAKITKTQGGSGGTNITNYSIQNSESPTQFWLEDIGGIG